MLLIGRSRSRAFIHSVEKVILRRVYYYLYLHLGSVIGRIESLISRYNIISATFARYSAERRDTSYKFLSSTRIEEDFCARAGERSVAQPVGNIIGRLGAHTRAAWTTSVSRHGKRYFSCFRDTLTKKHESF